MTKERGFWGIAFYEPKMEENIGTAIRSAHCFGVDFLAVIGKRYRKEPTDTTAAERHIPIYEYADLEDFKKHLPLKCEIVDVEVDGEDITNFVHPERAVYLIGGEDRTLPKVGKYRVKFNTDYCLNMAMAATLISYDPKLKNELKRLIKK